MRAPPHNLSPGRHPLRAHPSLSSKAQTFPSVGPDCSSGLVGGFQPLPGFFVFRASARADLWRSALKTKLRVKFERKKVTHSGCFTSSNQPTLFCLPPSSVREIETGQPKQLKWLPPRSLSSIYPFRGSARRRGRGGIMTQVSLRVGQTAERNAGCSCTHWLPF